MTAGPRTPHWRESVAWLTAAVTRVTSNGERAVGLLPLPEGVAEADVASAADFHGVGGFARRAASGHHPDLDRLAHVAQARHLRASTDLGLVSAALAARSIDVLVVKGPALVATCYGGFADLRSYVDLDVAVRPQQVGAAVRALEESGCRVLDGNWPLLTAQRAHELRLETPAGGALDLHWSLGASGGETGPTIRTLHARSVRIHANGTQFRTLAPDDLVVHLAVHAASSGGHRLVWFADMRAGLTTALVRTSPARVAACAEEWRSQEALTLMLRRTHSALGTNAPAELRGDSRPGLWRGLSRVAERMSPPELVGEGASVSRLVARSCRSSPARSLGAAAVKGVQALRSGQTGPLGVDVLHDRTHPMSGLYRVGGRAEAEAFYASVAEEWPD